MRRLTLGSYLKEWRSNREKVLGWFDETVTGYKRAVAVTWQTSVAQLTKPGRRLLERLAFLAPEPVPEFLLEVTLSGAENENLYKAFTDLATYSLVTSDAGSPSFLVHRLVQDVTRRSIKGGLRRQRLQEALNWIDTTIDQNPRDVRNWPRIEPLIAHARAVTGYGDNAGIAAPTFRLMNEVAAFLDTKALYPEAEPLMRRALAIIEAELTPQHPHVATALSNLASLLQDTGRMIEAEPLIRRALVIDEGHFGPDHPNVAIQLNNLASLLHDMGRHAEAEPLKRRALSIDETKLGPLHPSVAIRLNNLASLLLDTGRASEAEPLLRRALEIDEEHYGLDHPEVAYELSNLAAVLYQTSRSTEAVTHALRAAKILEKHYGVNHPQTAHARASLQYFTKKRDQ